MHAERDDSGPLLNLHVLLATIAAIVAAKTYPRAIL
jgi:hypothetical protein